MNQISASKEAIRILAVDDHPMFREGVVWSWATQPDLSVVAEASNGLEVIEQSRQHRPDIILMDLQMPVMNGLDATVAIRKEFPEAKIVILTTYESDVESVMKLGAQAFILRNQLGKEPLGNHTSRPHPEIRFQKLFRLNLAAHAADVALNSARRQL